MKAVLSTVVALALVAYVGVCAAMFAFQRSLLYFPQPRIVVDPRSTMTLPVDGAVVVVTVRPHDGPRAIVYFGGNAEDVSRNLLRYGDAFPDRASYLMHYRGYGGSTGQPTEKDNVADGIALVERVRATHPDVTIVGRSLGSGVAIQVASRVPVARLVLITPFDSIVAIAARLYPYVPVRWLARDRYESVAFAPGIAQPTALIVAANDEVIPRDSSDRLRERFAPGIATMTVIDRTGHNDIEHGADYRSTLRAAVDAPPPVGTGAGGPPR